MATEIPSLSSAGWIATPYEKLDKLLSYYFVSESSQTNIYRGQIQSLPADIKVAGNDEDGIIDRVRNSLTLLLEPYFDTTSVVVTVEYPDDASDSRMNVTCSINVTQDGVTYTASRMFQAVEGTLQRIFDINNQGR